MRPDLSILVCSIHTRYRTFALRIQDQLWHQHAALPGHPDRVEILILSDAARLTIAMKRNALLDISSGRYVQFVDDDDRLADGALAAVLAATGSNADAICFPVQVTQNGGPPRICRYSKDYGYDHNSAHEYRRLPNHICAVKRELAVATRFNDSLSFGEDADYARRLILKLNSEEQISETRPLYFYEYDRDTSASRR